MAKTQADKPDPIEKKIGRWEGQFQGYREPVTAKTIHDWLAQFGSRKEIGEKVLDAVDYYGIAAIEAAFRSTVQKIEGWNTDEKQRTGRWVFAPLQGAAGKSGAAMLSYLRSALRMSGKKYQKDFLYLSDLTSAGLGPEDTLVLVDDFAGTGDQASETWELLDEILPTEPRVVVVVVVSTRRAVSRLQKETPMTVKAHKRLDGRHNVFDEKCKFLTEPEREELLALCKRANKRTPRGYGDCGLTLVFCHKTPNNSIPVLHATTANWKGLFPRIAEH
ncbi:MAG: hypothetical protein AAF682_16980 [Planctomycetota bacterium]